MRRYLAVALTLVTALCSCDLFAAGWTKRNLDLSGCKTDRDRGRALREAIEHAESGSWFELPDVGFKLDMQIDVSASIKLTYVKANSQLKITGADAERLEYGNPVKSQVGHFFLYQGRRLELEGLDLVSGNGYDASCIESGGTLVMNRCTIRSCSVQKDKTDAASEGIGALTIFDGSASVTNCLFLNNTSSCPGNGAKDLYGSAVVTKKNTSHAEFVGCTFSGNGFKGMSSGAKARGGAICAMSGEDRYNLYPELVCVNCTFTGNENCLYADGDACIVVLAQCTLVNNVANKIDKQWAGTVRNNARLYAIGNVFFGNEDDKGAVTDVVQVKRDGGYVYSDWNVGKIDVTTITPPKTGRNISTDGLKSRDLFQAFACVNDTTVNCIRNMKSDSSWQYVFPVCSSVGENIFYSIYDDPVIWHSPTWSTIGCGKADGSDIELIWSTPCIEGTWDGGKTSVLTVANLVDIAGNPRVADGAVYNVVGSYNPQKCQITVNGNGGRSREYRTPTFSWQKDESPYCVVGGLNYSNWTNLGYHCVGYTNAYCTASGRGNTLPCSSFGANLENASVLNLWCKWERNNYKVYFNANGGTGSMPYQTMMNGEYVNLRKNNGAITRAGFIFRGWATKPGGKVLYSDGVSVCNILRSFTNNDSVTLYAVWMSDSAPVVETAAELRDAIEKVKSGAVIHVKPGTYSFSSGFTVDRNLTIENTSGNPATLAMKTVGKDRLFKVTSGSTLKLQGLYIKNAGGYNSDKSCGGAVYNAGRLEVRDCTFYNNSLKHDGEGTSARGAAIYNAGSAASVYAENCRFEKNSSGSYQAAGGGAIYNDNGRMTLSRCTFIGNAVRVDEASVGADPRGGALASAGASARVILMGCTFTQNTNALHFAGGEVALVHCTVVGNLPGARASRAAIDVENDCKVVAINSLIIGNSCNDPADTTYGQGPQVACGNSTKGGLRSYDSIIGYTFGFPVAQEWFGYHNARYRDGKYNPADYFDAYSKDLLPMRLSVTVKGVKQTFFPIKERLLQGMSPKSDAEDATLIGFDDETYGIVFPILGKGTLKTHPCVSDQLGRFRSQNTDTNYRYLPGAVGNFTTTFRYNANGGSGTMAQGTGRSSPYGKFKLANCGFSRPGYRFLGWGLSPATSVADSLEPGKSYEYSRILDTGNGELFANPIDLYAVWSKNSYRIVFDKNSSEASGSMEPIIAAYDELVELPKFAGFERTGYVVDAWNTKPNGSGTYYDNGQSVSNLSPGGGEEVKLYAVWSGIRYKVCYHENNGEKNRTASRWYSYGDKVGIAGLRSVMLSINWESEDHLFLGWNSAADGSGTAWAPGTEALNLCVEQGAIYDLYAQWTDELTIESVLGTALKFTTSGAGKWFGQNVVKLDGKPAVRSPAIGHDQEAVLQTKVYGRGTISYDYRVSSEKFGDVLQVTIDGIQKQLLSDEQSGTASFELTDFREHTIIWKYKKDEDTIGGEDAAWIGNVVWTPKTVVLQFNGNGTYYSESGEYQDGLKYLVFPAEPNFVDHAFEGWWTAEKGGKKITTQTICDSSITKVYAHWTEIPPTELKIPTAVTGLKYNGDEQNGVIRATDVPEPTHGRERETEAGTYTVEYEIPTGNYCWEDGSAEPQIIEWTIAPLEITAGGITVDEIPAQTGDGVTELEPLPVVKYRGDELVKDVDYELTYSDNILLGGSAKVNIIGKGNFTGTRSVPFTILAAVLPGVPVIDSQTPADGVVYERHDEPVMLDVQAHVPNGKLEYRWSVKIDDDVFMIGEDFAAENHIVFNPETPGSLVVEPGFFGLQEAREDDEFIFTCEVVGEDETIAVTMPVVQKKFTYRVFYLPNWDGATEVPPVDVANSGVGYEIGDGATMFTREGWEFDGWKDASGEEWTVGSAGIDMTSGGCIFELYAQWKMAGVSTYTVRFQGNGADSGSMTDLSAPLDENVQLPPNRFSRDGYRFVEWNMTDDGIGEAFEDEARVRNLGEKDETVRLYAQWEELPLIATIRFCCVDADEGTIPDPIEFTPGDPVTLSRTPTRAGFLCLGWSSTEGGPVEYEAGSVQTFDLTRGAEKTIYAVWEPHVDYEKEAMPEPDPEGYILSYLPVGDKGIFIGWQDPVPPTVTKEIPAVIDGHEIFQAGNPGVVIYVGSGVSKLIVPETITKVGQNSFMSAKTTYFLGNRPAIAVTGGDDGPGDEVSEYGICREGSVLAYPANDSTWNGVHVTEPWTDTVRATAYVLGVIDGVDGSDTSGSDTAFFFLNEEGKADFAGSYSEYLVKFTLPATVDGPFGAATVNGIDPSCGDANVVEIQWEADSVPPANIKDYFPNLVKITYPLENAENIGTVVIPGVVIEPDGAVPYFTIHFDAKGGEGTMPDCQIAIPGGNLPPNAFTNKSRAFLGWKDESGTEYADGAFVQSSAPGTITLYASWSEPIEFCNVTFDGNGAEFGAMKDQKIICGLATALAENTFERDGYLFAGWSTEKDGALAYGNGQEIVADTATLTLYAVWNEVVFPSYTVRFRGNGGVGNMEDQICNISFVVLLSANSFTREGYEFAGWNTMLDGTGTGYINCQAIVDEVPEGEILTLYAQWNGTEPPPTPPEEETEEGGGYTVKFDANGGTGTMKPQMIAYDEQAELRANAFVFDNHTFVGWSLAPDGIVSVRWKNCEPVKNLAAPGDTVTLYALWTVNEPPAPIIPLYTEDGEINPASELYVEPELFDVKAETPFVGNTTYNGWLRDGAGLMKGSLTIKAAKPGKDGKSKLSATYIPFGGKKLNVKFDKKAMPDAAGNPEVLLRGVGTVRFGGESLAGVDINVQAGADFSKDKDKSRKSAYNALVANRDGVWTFALNTSAGYAGFSVSVKKGKGKFTGALPDGTKVSVSTAGALGSNGFAIPCVFSKKAAVAFVFWVMDDGTAALSDVTAVKLADGSVKPVVSWTVPSRSFALQNGDIGSHAFSCGDFAQLFGVSGKKWNVPKHQKKAGADDPNPLDLKLTFTPKTGVVKGSFTVIDAAGKKVKYTVNGVVVGNRFCGAASAKKHEPLPCTAW